MDSEMLELRALESLKSTESTESMESVLEFLGLSHALSATSQRERSL